MLIRLIETMSRVAIAVPKSWELFCPKCDEILASPSGSLFWLSEDFLHVDLMRCECGEGVKVPARLIKAGS